MRVILTKIFLGGFPSFTSASGRGNVQLDVERPVMLEVSTDSLQRLKGIIALVSVLIVLYIFYYYAF